MNISDLRKIYHRNICHDLLRLSKIETKIYPNFSDSSSKASISIGLKIIEIIGFPIAEGKILEQKIGDLFEERTKEFVESSFSLLNHIRPGQWLYSTKHTEISGFEQYQHLAKISSVIKGDKELSTALGGDYLVKPDIVVSRSPIDDSEINKIAEIISKKDSISTLTPLRNRNQRIPGTNILHASISCKWTIRSDRSQNTRTEALNLIRNRKGNLPHVIAVTAEPLPTRIATLALGTGDLDCVYHFALSELIEAVETINNEDQKEMLDVMVKGNRLRDISDLPFDLAI